MHQIGDRGACPSRVLAPSASIEKGGETGQPRDPARQGFQDSMVASVNGV
jgi:hypothetical protein